MKHYIDPKGNLHAIEEGYQHLLPPGSAEATEEQVAAIRAAVPEPPPKTAEQKLREFFDANPDVAAMIGG